ncbi:Vpu [Vagococcus vulneris]|uniref:Uncharacterized protein n=1 Tax=Vagococcus vulneris TaxID=1977869 RepID=A0A430A1H8_9ENTE|nr:Vpu [Vagococcus vulneris]RSU00217.1 hypothetical protein CBF37_02665 [Vagococcus vulneris]
MTPQIMITFVVLLIIIYIIWKIYTIFTENKKINDNINQLKQRNKERRELFSPINEVDGLELDTINQLFHFKGQFELFEFNELLNFDVQLNNKPINLNNYQSQQTEILFDALDSVKQADHLDLVFYTSGINEGKYSHQLLYQPLTQNSEERVDIINKLDKLITIFYQILNTKKGPSQ